MCSGEGIAGDKKRVRERGRGVANALLLCALPAGRAHGVAVLRSCLCSRGAHQVRWGRRGAANLAAQVAGRCVANTSPRPRDESVAADVRGRLPEMHVVTCVRAASGYGVPSARGGGRLDSMAGAGSARRSEQRACLGPRLAMLEINVTPRVG